jgi:hypothetical protein
MLYLPNSPIAWYQCCARELGLLRDTSGQQVYLTSKVMSTNPIRTADLLASEAIDGTVVQLRCFTKGLRSCISMSSAAGNSSSEDSLVSKFFESTETKNLLLEVNIGRLKPLCRSAAEIMLEGVDFSQEVSIYVKVFLSKKKRFVYPMMLQAFKQHEEEGVELVFDKYEPHKCFMVISMLPNQLQLIHPVIHDYKEPNVEEEEEEKQAEEESDDASWKIRQ